ncbi:MAG: class I SAM-dependent methyltransferase [Anaerolineae bacterium]
MAWLLLVAGLFLGAMAYWQLVIAEGAYLGARAVALLYDWTAHRYDRIKRFRSEEEEWFLARPLREALRNVPRPLVLDVATGTGRLPEALFRAPAFPGRVVGLDLSRGMLGQARQKLARHRDQAFWAWANAVELPFASGVFDAVTCLEALEFTPDPIRALQEMVRVLRPGGILLVTNRIGWESRLLPGHAFQEEELRRILDKAGLQGVYIGRWQVHYDQVWARKPGWTAPLLATGREQEGKPAPMQSHSRTHTFRRL